MRGIARLVLQDFTVVLHRIELFARGYLTNNVEKNRSC